jgi:predicted acyl esterase
MGALAVLAFAPSAQAAITSALGQTCTANADNANIRVCGGVTETFDGTTPIDVNVFLPPTGDGPFPVIGWFHGWGGSKFGLGNAANAKRIREWALDGYAVFSMSDRGWGMSCGGQDPKRPTPACANGYNHLMDTRYEVRDAQYMFGRLADENIIIPDKIGVTGGSYGGGISMALAALRSRVMTPDDKLVPWTSPGGKPMSIAVALADIPWTDLAYSLQPNGRNLDYVTDNTYLGPKGDYPIGVLKQSFTAGLYATGQATSNYALPGQDPDADLVQWYALVNAGEPYDENPQAADVVDELTTHHSSYYIPRRDEYGTTAPAPLLISNGWTDDLFPPDEAIRFYNRTRSEFPQNDISLFFFDWGHQRGQNRETELAKLRAAQDAWLDHYLKGVGSKPPQGAAAIRQTCDDEESASVAVESAPAWDELSPGEVRFTDASSKTIAPGATNPQANQAFDPIAAGNDPCKTSSAQDVPGTATYRLPAAGSGGYTLMGSPTIIADITSPSPTSHIAARLLDVDPEGNQTLVARGLYRPDSEGRQVFQLHPNGWLFAEGHVAKLELSANDAPYGRASNGQGPVTVANLDLRLPVREKIGTPAPNVLPEGTQPAPGTEAAGPCGTGIAEQGTKRKDTLKGTDGGDRLRGGKGKDKIAGKGGDDCLNGGKDKDRVTGGNGDDKVKARDGKRDRVNCGKGKDTVTADRKDRLRGCEKKKR